MRNFPRRIDRLYVPWRFWTDPIRRDTIQNELAQRALLLGTQRSLGRAIVKITFLLHPQSWLTYSDAVVFMPVLSRYADPEEVKFVPEPREPGDILLALHYPALIPKDRLALHKNNIVIHGADLPKGRGRSPVHWQVEDGINDIVLTMIELDDKADSGPIYMKSVLKLDGTELLPAIRVKIVKAEIEMLDSFLSQWPMTAKEQKGEASYYKKRTKESQQLDPQKTIAEQFDKMRVADNDAYPLWFEHRGVRYTLKIESQAPRPL